MIGRTNAVVGGSTNVVYVQLNYATAGITITATSSGLPTKTADTDATGKATFRNLKVGTYTFTTAGGATVAETIDALVENIAISVSRLTVTSNNTGVTQITATKDGVTVTKAYDNGAVFYDLSAGTWTIGDGTDTKTVTVTAGGDVTATLGGQIIEMWGSGGAPTHFTIYLNSDLEGISYTPLMINNPEDYPDIMPTPVWVGDADGRTIKISDAQFIIGETYFVAGQNGSCEKIELKTSDGVTLLSVTGLNSYLSGTFTAVSAERYYLYGQLD